MKASHTGRFLEPILKRDRERMEQRIRELEEQLASPS